MRRVKRSMQIKKAIYIMKVNLFLDIAFSILYRGVRRHFSDKVPFFELHGTFEIVAQ